MSGTSARRESVRAVAPFSVDAVRRDFPLLSLRQDGRPLVFLDNAASTQKPQSVIDRIREFYSAENANIHRGVYRLSERATAEYEAVRTKVAKLLNAPSPSEVIFTKGTTESINLVASSFGRRFLQAGDEIVLSQLEHHSNIVPWQMIAAERGATIRVIPMDEHGALRLDEARKLFSAKTRILSVGHISNALGTVNPVRELVQMAHAVGASVLLDGAQAIAHEIVDVQALGCDFYAFSSHKLFGPTGVGVLWGRKELLDSMPPYQGGGDMIRTVSFSGTTYADLPHKFEAGTPPIAGVIGMGTAIDYLMGLDRSGIAIHEQRLLKLATDLLSDVPGVRILGTAPHKSSIVSFTMEGIHPHDLGTILDKQAVAVRAGHHCAQPVMEFFDVPATARASFAFYNTREEVDKLADAIQKVIEVFA